MSLQRFGLACFLHFCLTLSPAGLSAQTSVGSQAVATNSAGAVSLQKQEGLLPIHWDEKKGKLFLGVPLTEKNGTASPQYVLADALTYAVGQNDLQMDRGQIGINANEIIGPDTRLVHFERSGPKLLLVQENTKFRTSSADPAERLAVLQSFPSSILAGFDIADETDGFVVVDATAYLLQDAQAVSEILASKKQGNYKADLQRSTIVPESSKAFPKNTEIESELTFVSDDPNNAKILADVAPDVRALTVHERRTFLKLPEPGFIPRLYSPRAGYFDLTYREMNTPLGVDVDQQFIFRHRLEKKNPACLKDCEAVRPIQYYVDRGAPEPLRTALVEGARWWDEAFQAAGWAKGTFRVDLLPVNADPMDAQYNIIQWVHRANRGWSFGLIIADPRTGEILKGNVTLGSLRGRQDYLLAEALLAPYKDGKVPDAAQDKALAMVLARIRQLAAHETGHTLGLRHNYAASTMPHSPDETMSVMDYPHPWITLGPNGIPDLSHAYPTGIGTWDKVTIDYGYREFDKDGKSVDDSIALESILHSAELKGSRYLSDEDSRPRGSASPIAHLWDNGPDAANELNRILDVRKAALQRFCEDTIREGVPTAQMEDTLVPLYLLHRYQTEAATKLIGGLDYRYTVRGDGQKGPQVVSPEEQRAAIAAVVKTLSPEVLTIPETLLHQLPPRTPGMRGNPDGSRNVESFISRTSVTFDPVATAESAADLTLMLLFNPARANRLFEYHARYGSQPTLEEVIDSALRSADSASKSGGLENLVSAAVKARILEALFRLGSDPDTSFAVRSAVLAKLQAIAGSQPTDANGQEIKRRVAKYVSDPENIKLPSPVVPAPPGSPIGDDDTF
jgi:Met-zincin/Domain of unknown function (DUF5117)